MRIKVFPNCECPRERLDEQGLDALAGSELNAFLLRTGLQRKSGVEVGGGIDPAIRNPQ